ncbi:MAG TPA: glycosyltransferase family 2 protein [Bacteroidia bacterium]|jgi:glycosyltransferase involved in cell wall biosynthesis|nr:glycosyltransferase family 2 protein [Bacteroidia bacterium]
MKTVSVIIPTWNRSKTLLTAVNSALNQTYPILEVLICDDGSTDNSKEIIAAINDTRVKWIDCGRNGRPAIPRNIGIKESKGEWLAFLDSDDEWFVQKIQKQMDALKQHLECLAVSSNADIVDAEGKKRKQFHLIDASKFTFKDLLNGNFIICSSALIHRSLIEKAGNFPEQKEFKAIEDYLLWLKIAAYTEWAYLKEPLLNYLDNPTQSIRADDIGPWQQRKIILSELIQWLDNHKFNVPLFYKKLVQKELLLARFKTSNHIHTRLFYRLRYALS